MVQAWVYRNYYFDGPVSVTVTPVAGTATAGTDFAADSVTVTWGDQDADAKLVEFQLVDDKEQEGDERFSPAALESDGRRGRGAARDAIHHDCRQ